MAKNNNCPRFYRFMSHKVENNLQNKTSHKVGLKYVRAALKDNIANFQQTTYNLSQV